jgi:hypothetical protein
MQSRNKILTALLVGMFSLAGIGGFAFAQGGYHGGMGYHGGGYHGGGMGYYGGGGCGGGYGPGGFQGPGPRAALPPEAYDIMQKSYTETAPLFLELRAKQAELSAKIYSNADDATIQGLVKEITDLQTRLTQARVTMNKQLAKAGVPLNSALGNCPGFGMGGGFGYHQRGFRGMGFHRNGYGPCGGQGAPLPPPDQRDDRAE